MTHLGDVVSQILRLQQATAKPLAIILAGHNGSGKSTMWRKSLSDQVRIPLVNADRMMLSILPEAGNDGALPSWAQDLRDKDEGWMRVAQEGVQAFVAHAMGAKVPFAMETVFSYWQEQPDGSVASKIDMIRDMQRAGYFVLLIFVGLTNVTLSILRVRTRVAENGHDVPEERLEHRFPRTQHAIRAASAVADASIFVDNSRESRRAFTVCRVQTPDEELFDLRRNGGVPPVIREWMDVVCPIP